MAKIIGAALPNIPWQERPADCQDPVWRYSGNPIIGRDAIPSSNSVFGLFKGRPALEHRPRARPL